MHEYLYNSRECCEHVYHMPNEKRQGLQKGLNIAGMQSHRPIANYSIAIHKKR